MKDTGRRIKRVTMPSYGPSGEQMQYPDRIDNSAVTICHMEIDDILASFGNGRQREAEKMIKANALLLATLRNNAPALIAVVEAAKKCDKFICKALDYEYITAPAYYVTKETLAILQDTLDQFYREVVS